MADLVYIDQTVIDEVVAMLESEISILDANEETLDHAGKLRIKLSMVFWDILCERYDFFREFLELIVNWEGQLPDLRDIFGAEKMNWLLIQSMMCDDHDAAMFIEFVIRSGYKGEPYVNKYGKRWTRRTDTALHWAVESRYGGTFVPELFKIYDRFDVNCIDKRGLTHFHVACYFGCLDVVEKFLELGQDPNIAVQETGDTPLYMALDRGHKDVARLLLKSGVKPNVPNYYKNRWTLLHFICGKINYESDHAIEMLFEISDELNQPLLINARDKVGLSPLHVALIRGHRKLSKLLLRKGANPNLTNKGSTPLHYICQRDDDDNYWIKMLFEITDDIQQTVQVDARDRWRRTPLHWAVANLKPNTVDILLDRGADLSKFAFPPEALFTKLFEFQRSRICDDFQLELVSGVLEIVERLEKRGYHLDRSEASNIINLFAKYCLSEKPTDLEKSLRSDGEFVNKAKKLMMNSSLSLYDFIQLRPDEAAKLFTYSDYFEFARSKKLRKLPEESIRNCAMYLCKIISRRFSHQWGLEFFSELSHYKLPTLCCEKIIGILDIEDWWMICSAATIGQPVESNACCLHG